MNTEVNLEVNKSKSGTRQKQPSDVSSSPVRIRHKTKAKLEQLLQQANKDRIGKKIKTDDLISFSLDLITENHLAEICSKALSNKDRMELLFRKIAKERRGITKDEFLGLLLSGKLTL